MEFTVALELLRALDTEKVEYILVGGLAVNLHGIVRATQDIDLFLRLDHENIEKVKRALRLVWEDPEIDQIRYEDLAGEYPTVRYGPPNEDFVVDLITGLGETFRFEDLQAEQVRIEGVPIRIATPQTLIRMQKNTLRELGRIDAAQLREHFNLPED